ncbi:MAG: rhodanese-like domain-containing protein [Actinomycetota bacterium]|nr:rhodanese-like domain-containing protein [Acidimicrobiia bacterium]MDQ3468810.1 rhodanese-like domain-containing protein [Actinomycetota bacterium]
MTTSRIDDQLERARARLRRVEPADLDAEMVAGALVVDIRHTHYRRDEGELPGAIVIERNVLEWRLDPTCEASLPEATQGRRVILFCNDSYASSLAAVALVDLGLADATDLAGGYRGWRAMKDAAESSPLT